MENPTALRVIFLKSAWKTLAAGKCLAYVLFIYGLLYSRPLSQTALLNHSPKPIRAVVVAGAEGAAAPVNFVQRVHAPVNFQPFQF